MNRRLAAELGFTHYDALHPCEKGHKSKRYVCNGACVECNREKLLAVQQSRKRLPRASFLLFGIDWETFKAEVLAAAAYRWPEHNLEGSARCERKGRVPDFRPVHFNAPCHPDDVPAFKGRANQLRAMRYATLDADAAQAKRDKAHQKRLEEARQLVEAQKGLAGAAAEILAPIPGSYSGHRGGPKR